MTPEEHDERLLALERSLTKASKEMSKAERSVRLAVGQRRRNGVWSEDLPDSPDLLPALEAIQSIRSEIDGHERNYSGWSRFRLVTSSEGHVHGDRKCRAFRPSTTTIIIPALSGKTAPDVVEMLGDVSCSFCLPGGVGSARKVSLSAVSALVRHGTEGFNRVLERRRSRVTDVTLQPSGSDGRVES